VSGSDASAFGLGTLLAPRSGWSNLQNLVTNPVDDNSLLEARTNEFENNFRSSAAQHPVEMGQASPMKLNDGVAYLEDTPRWEWWIIRVVDSIL